MNKNPLEQLAALEHEQWAKWTRHFLENATPENLARWKRQTETPYDQLSEEEKDADRVWARRVLAQLCPAAGEGSEILFPGKHLHLKTKSHWEYVERTKASGIVAILPITNQNEIILVEQFRIPVGKRVIEIPAGLAGDVEGEEAEEMANAARRELLEETGYEAETMDFLTEGPPSAGLSTEIVTFFQARGLKKVGSGGGDGTENIQAHLVPLAKFDAWIDAKRRDGCLVDYKVYAALYFTLRPQ